MSASDASAHVARPRAGGSTSGPAGPRLNRHPRADGEWVVRAQDGEAATVLAEVEGALHNPDLDPRARSDALYVRAICLRMLGQERAAITVARELTDMCQGLGLQALGLRSRALLVDLLRQDGQLADAVEELAHAVLIERNLHDLEDPEIQAALGALAVALRHSGVANESRRIEQRLACVEEELPRSQRVGRWSTRTR